MIKGVAVGRLAPGASAIKILHLVNTGAVGDRMIDISVQSRSTASASHVENEDDTVNSPGVLDVTDTLRTVSIPTVDPFNFQTNTIYRRPLRQQPGLGDMRTFDKEYWDDSDGGEAFISSVFKCEGPWNLEIESFILSRMVSVVYILNYSEVLTVDLGSRGRKITRVLDC
jgi:trafficking protein particle complex subunit 11